MLGFSLIALLIFLSTFQSLLTRYYSTAYPGKENLSSLIFSIFSGSIVVLVTLCLARFRLEISSVTWILGAVNALVLILYNTCMLKAAATGPYSVTIVSMIAGGIVIPAVAARLLGDDLNVVKIICIIVILLSVYLISYKPGERYTDKKMFFLSCAGLAIGNGLYGTILDIHTRLTTPAASASSPEREEIIILTYLGAALFSLVLLVVKERKAAWTAMKQSRKSLGFLISASLVISMALNVMVYSLGLIDTTLLYTFDNACVFLLSVLFSVVFFRERLSVRNIIGCCVLCLALVCMSLSAQIYHFFV